MAAIIYGVFTTCETIIRRQWQVTNLFLSSKKTYNSGEKECKNKCSKIVVDARKEVNLESSEKMTLVSANLPANYNRQYGEWSSSGEHWECTSQF